jgi:hypothetical protein
VHLCLFDHVWVPAMLHSLSNICQVPPAMNGDMVAQAVLKPVLRWTFLKHVSYKIGHSCILIVRLKAKDSTTRKCEFSDNSRSWAPALGEPAPTVSTSYRVWLVRIVGSSSD